MLKHSDAVRQVARKEFRALFASPAAYLFIASFLAATLFSVFWVETFLHAILPMYARCSSGCRYC